MQKTTFIAILIGISFALFFWYLVASSFYDVAVAEQKSFVTDNCTLFPNGSWQKCCVEHDRLYWNGGSVQQRYKADQKFRSCIEASGNKALSLITFVGVRIGGMPYFAVPWRWGYGWEFGRGYR